MPHVPYASSLMLKLGIGAPVTLLAATFLGCAADGSEPVEDGASDTPVSADAAIVHGAKDGDKHPSVIALVSSEGGLCTGSLVAPNLVLTARHCVSQLASPYVDCPASGPQVGRTLTASSFAAYPGEDAASGPPAARGTRVFVPKGAVLCGADVAVIELDRALPGLTPLRISRRALPTSITAVGYGQIGDRGRAGQRRYRAHVPVVEATNADLTVGESTCSGDSGGPALDEATGEIVGVLSRGGPTCDGKGNRNIYTRLTGWLDFLESAGVPVSATPTTPAPGAPTSDLGEPCTDGASCSAGVCITGGGSGYCSRPCGTGGPRCPAGYRCTPLSGSSARACARH